ncbi:hypothetical protein DFJ73DRAFT_568661 [Zopfochytrium polystomum]|nr:hypothetical protein DFJ73DRAFT_568661 [Zopfochytrium polystomum]
MTPSGVAATEPSTSLNSDASKESPKSHGLLDERTPRPGQSDFIGGADPATKPTTPKDTIQTNSTSSHTRPSVTAGSSSPVGPSLLGGNAALLSVLSGARESQIVADASPEPSHRRSASGSQSVKAITADAALPEHIPLPPDDSVAPRAAYSQGMRSQSLQIGPGASFQTQSLSVILFCHSHPKDPLVASLQNDHLVLRAPKRMTHPLADRDGVFLSELLVLVTLKLRKRKSSGSVGKIGTALTGAFRRTASAGSTLRPASPNPNSPRLMEAVEEKITTVLKRGLSKSGSSEKSSKSLSKPRSSPELRASSAELPAFAADAHSLPLSEPLPSESGSHGESSAESSSIPLFTDGPSRSSSSSFDSETFWSGSSGVNTVVGNLHSVPPVPSLPPAVPGGSTVSSSSSAKSSTGSAVGGPTSAPPSPSASVSKSRRIGTGFDENDDQLSGKSQKKIVFKIITPSREVIMSTSSSSDFKEFRNFIEQNRARILSGFNEQDDDLSSIGDEAHFSVTVNEGRRMLKFLKDAHESNRMCASCGMPDPEWVAYERSMNITILLCEVCSGVYRGHANYFVRSFLYDISLFQDTQSESYRVVQSTVNVQSVAELLRASELGTIPAPPSLYDFSGPPPAARPQPTLVGSPSFGSTSSSAPSNKSKGRFARGLGLWRDSSRGSNVSSISSSVSASSSASGHSAGTGGRDMVAIPPPLVVVAPPTGSSSGSHSLTSPFQRRRTSTPSPTAAPPPPQLVVPAVPTSVEATPSTNAALARSNSSASSVESWEDASLPDHPSPFGMPQQPFASPIPPSPLSAGAHPPWGSGPHRGQSSVAFNGSGSPQQSRRPVPGHRKFPSLPAAFAISTRGAASSSSTASSTSMSSSASTSAASAFPPSPRVGGAPSAAAMPPPQSSSTLSGSLPILREASLDEPRRNSSSNEPRRNSSSTGRPGTPASTGSGLGAGGAGGAPLSPSNERKGGLLSASVEAGTRTVKRFLSRMSDRGNRET